MRRLILLLSFAVVVASSAPAQLCTPLEIGPLPRPYGWVPPDFKYWVHNVLFDYAGGRYFLSAFIDPWDSGSPDPVTAVSADGENFHRFSLGAPPGQATLIGRPYYLHGFYYHPFFSPGCLVRSPDGFQWEVLPVCSGCGINEVNWTGEQLVVTGCLGGVWTSSDNGATWTPRTPVPDVYRPMFTGWADRYRLIVGGSEIRGYTEDYENWNVEFLDPDHTGIPGPSCVNGENFGNGWLLCGGERTRDGTTWETVAHNPTWGTLFFAGRQFFGWVYPDENVSEDGEQIKTLKLARSSDGTSWETRTIGELHGRVLTDILMGPETMGWDGIHIWSVYSRNVADSEHPRTWEKYLVASTRCADLGDPVVLPGVAHIEGYNGSLWRTAASFYYPGPGVSEALLEWLPFGKDNATPERRRLNFATGQSQSFEDIVGELFGAAGAGSLRVVSVGAEVVVHARTYNDVGDGTFGQEIPGWRWEDGIGPGDEGWLAGLADSGTRGGGFRTNVGLQNLWEEPVEVEVVFLDREGAELGRRRAHLAPFAGVQWFRPLRDLAPGGVGDVTALVRIVSGDSRVAAYASLIDNRSGDPSNIRAAKLPRQDTVPPETP